DLLPALSVPELFPLVRKVREEQALLGMILPAAASQPSVVLEQVRSMDGVWAAMAIESLVVPTRVFVIPDELAAMHKLFDEYQKSPRTARDESPQDWVNMHKTVETDATSHFSVFFIKPKHRRLMMEGEKLSALRQTSQAGLAVAAYH